MKCRHKLNILSNHLQRPMTLVMETAQELAICVFSSYVDRVVFNKQGISRQGCVQILKIDS